MRLPTTRWFGGLVALGGLVSAPAPMAQAHPHVFIDGGVDFHIGPDQHLTALRVTWAYDAFETLYMLAANEMSLNDQGGLDETDRLELIRRLSNWPEDFDGSAHLTIDDTSVDLDWPTDLNVQMIDSRLRLIFTRSLPQAAPLSGRTAEVAFFESSYFFDFSLTDPPQIIGDTAECSTQITLFDPESGDQELLDVLARLSREETSDIPNVGSFFADRITLQCAP